MSDQIKLGVLCDSSAGRDAIHIAIAPVVAGHILEPGERVGWMDAEARTVGRVPSTFGIVDPFLTDPVLPGQRFFVCLYQQSITSLRHIWTHPAFTETDVALPVTKAHSTHKEQSYAWLRAHAERIDIGFNGLMRAAQTWLEEDEYTVQDGHTSWRDDFGDPAEFWHHYEIVTGTIVPPSKKTSFFCCSC